MDPINIGSGWRERLEVLAGRRLEAWAIGGLMVIVAGVALVLWFTRSTAHIAPPAQAIPAGLQSPTQSEASVLVHVAGAVRRPGVYKLPADARVADAIESAGDARPAADLNALNLASVVSDGMQILVPARASEASLSAPAPTGAASPSPAPVNVNTADGPALETVPGIGPVTATAIIEYRESSGGFSSVEELIDVSGIGPATLEAIRPYVTV